MQHLIDTLKAALEHQAEVEALFNPVLDQATLDVEKARTNLFNELKSKDIKTFDTDAVQLQIRKTTSTIITNEADLWAALQEVGVLEDYLLARPLDRKPAAKYAKEHELPGVTERTSETIVVKWKQ